MIKTLITFRGIDWSIEQFVFAVFFFSSFFLPTTHLSLSSFRDITSFHIDRYIDWSTLTIVASEKIGLKPFQQIRQWINQLLDWSAYILRQSSLFQTTLSRLFKCKFCKKSNPQLTSIARERSNQKFHLFFHSLSKTSLSFVHS